MTGSLTWRGMAAIPLVGVCVEGRVAARLAISRLVVFNQYPGVCRPCESAVWAGSRYRPRSCTLLVRKDVRDKGLKIPHIPEHVQLNWLRDAEPFPPDESVNLVRLLARGGE